MKIKDVFLYVYLTPIQNLQLLLHKQEIKINIEKYHNFHATFKKNCCNFKLFVPQLLQKMPARSWRDSFIVRVHVFIFLIEKLKSQSLEKKRVQA